MAKITLGGIVGEIRNKAGDLVYSRNRGGAYVKGYVIPSNVITTRRTAVRTAWTTVSKAWAGTLTEAQRATWRALAQSNQSVRHLGNRQPPSGFEWFIKINALRSQAGLALLTTAHQSLQVNTPTNFSIVTPGGAGAWTLSAITPTPSSAEMLEIWGTALGSVGRVNFNSQLRFLAFAGPPAPASINVRSVWIAKFGSPATGKRVAIAIRVISTTTGAFSHRLAILSNT